MTTAVVASLPIVLALESGCRRSETSSARSGAAPAVPAPTEIDREETPTIRSAAEPGRPPFAGLSEPRDGAVDRVGRVWIADFGHSRLRVFDENGGDLGGWGARGSATYGFKDPGGVAVHENDVYVADTWNGRVQHFTLAGEWKGTASGLFGPRGVAVAPDGRVWVTDTGNHQVRSYDRALGVFEPYGRHGSGPAEFSSPIGIAVGDSGDVYVVDTGNRRIVVLASDGKPRSSWSIPGWDQPLEPHIEVDSDGSLYVTDPGSAAAVLHLDHNGRTIETWTTGDHGEKFSLPTGLALNRSARALYVINRGNNAVLRRALGAVRKG